MTRLPYATLSVLTAASLALIFSADDPVGDARERVERDRASAAWLDTLPVLHIRATERPWTIAGQVAVDAPRFALALREPDARGDVLEFPADDLDERLADSGGGGI